MSLIDQHQHAELSGNVYAKKKGVIIAREAFRKRSRCKAILRLFCNKYGSAGYDISVIFD